MDQPAVQEQELDQPGSGNDDLSFLVETVVVTANDIEILDATDDQTTQPTDRASDVPTTSENDPDLKITVVNGSASQAAQPHTKTPVHFSTGDSSSTVLNEEERLSLVNFVAPRIARVASFHRTIKDEVWNEISQLMRGKHGGDYNPDRLRDKWGYLKSDAPRMNQRIHQRDPRPGEDIHPTLAAVYAAVLKNIPDKYLSQKWRLDVQQSSSLKDCTVKIHPVPTKTTTITPVKSEVLKAAKYRVKKADGTWEVLTREELDARQKRTGAQLKILTPGQSPAKRKLSVEGQGAASESPAEKKPSLKERFCGLREARGYAPTPDQKSTPQPSQTSLINSGSSSILAKERNKLLSQQNQYLREISESLALVASSLSGKDV